MGGSLESLVISHFYNEAYLLPWWLDHHVRLFDHGILINYASTDSSVEICKQRAPHWKVIDSVNPDFDAYGCDKEVMEWEETFDGYKMALNTTEFLLVADNKLETLCQELESAAHDRGRSAIWVPAVAMVDMEEKNPSYSDSLFDVCHYGYDASVNPYSRNRLFHNHSRGDYSLGRHPRNHFVPDSVLSKTALLSWFCFAPWNENTIQRKLQIKKRISESDKKAGIGVQHYIEREELIIHRKCGTQSARDLRDKLKAYER